ncbi:gamma-secretase aspartyl protease complex, presenilin enhancer-2 subunit [Dichotomocladium elegans]|nr:gamma-secretase aspartyl protease complex, presenilin enhancer-2 subunit [Dichotomocladium elegans]
MPKVDKMTPEEQVSISKKMFYGGFAFLPLLWLVNFLYLFRASQQRTAPRELRRYVYMSLGGCIVWFVILTTWYALFVNKRITWGAVGDKITVVIPKGI